MTRNHLLGAGTLLLVVAVAPGAGPPLGGSAGIQSSQPVLMPAFEWDPEWSSSLW